MYDHYSFIMDCIVNFQAGYESSLLLYNKLKFLNGALW